MAVCPSSWNNSATTRQIFMKFDMRIFETSVKKFKFYKNLTKITGTLHEDMYIYGNTSEISS
jgi:hypothetical protein